MFVEHNCGDYIFWRKGVLEGRTMGSLSVVCLGQNLFVDAVWARRGREFLANRWFVSVSLCCK